MVLVGLLGSGEFGAVSGDSLASSSSKGAWEVSGLEDFAVASIGWLKVSRSDGVEDCGAVSVASLEAGDDF